MHGALALVIMLKQHHVKQCLTPPVDPLLHQRLLGVPHGQQHSARSVYILHLQQAKPVCRLLCTAVTHMQSCCPKVHRTTTTVCAGSDDLRKVPAVYLGLNSAFHIARLSFWCYLGRHCSQSKDLSNLELTMEQCWHRAICGRMSFLP